MKAKGDELETISEIARRLNVSLPTPSNWIHRGINGKKLPAIKIGGQYRVNRRDFQAWIELLNKPRQNKGEVSRIIKEASLALE